MNMIMKKHLCLLLTVFILSACQSEPKAEVTPTALPTTPKVAAAEVCKGPEHEPLIDASKTKKIEVAVSKQDDNTLIENGKMVKLPFEVVAQQKNCNDASKSLTMIFQDTRDLKNKRYYINKYMEYLGEIPFTKEGRSYLMGLKNELNQVLSNNKMDEHCGVTGGHGLSCTLEKTPDQKIRMEISQPLSL
jgi:hypothetical protein